VAGDIQTRIIPGGHEEMAGPAALGQIAPVLSARLNEFQQQEGEGND